MNAKDISIQGPKDQENDKVDDKVGGGISISCSREPERKWRRAQDFFLLPEITVTKYGQIVWTQN